MHHTGSPEPSVVKPDRNVLSIHPCLSSGAGGAGDLQLPVGKQLHLALTTFNIG